MDIVSRRTVLPHQRNNNATQLRARLIMGRNFFGVEEAIKYFGLIPSEAQLIALSDIPFSASELQHRRDTHILVAILPLSIAQMRRMVKREVFGQHEDAWWNDEGFARDCGRTGWYLLRRNAVPMSMGKSWEVQQTLLEHNEAVPDVQVAAYAITGHYLATGESLFDDIAVRCQGSNSRATYVSVGRYSGKDVSSDRVGVASHYVGELRSRSDRSPSVARLSGPSALVY